MFGVSLGIIDSGGAGGGGGSYESIATVTSAGSSATLDFTSIVSDYKHLQIRGTARATGSTSGPMYVYLQLNSTTGYARHQLRGNGASATAAGATSETYAQIGGGAADGSYLPANIFSGIIIDIIDYASTTKNKTIRSFGGVDPNASDGAIVLSSNLATGLGTSAVTSITLRAPSGNFASGTVFSLYGIKG